MHDIDRNIPKQVMVTILLYLFFLKIVVGLRGAPDLFHRSLIHAFLGCVLFIPRSENTSAQLTLGDVQPVGQVSGNYAPEASHVFGVGALLLAGSKSKHLVAFQTAMTHRAKVAQS